MKAGSTAMTQRPRDSFQGKHSWSARPKNARQNKSTHKLLMIPFFDSTGMIYMQWVPTGQYSQQGILCWGFKGVQVEIPSEEASNLQIGSVAFPPGQCSSQQLHPSHRPPYGPDHDPCDCWLFRGCRYETIEEMKEAVTKVIVTLTQGDFHGAFQNLLERYNWCIATGGD